MSPCGGLNLQLCTHQACSQSAYLARHFPTPRSIPPTWALLPSLQAGAGSGTQVLSLHSWRWWSYRSSPTQSAWTGTTGLAPGSSYQSTPSCVQAGKMEPEMRVVETAEAL